MASLSVILFLVTVKSTLCKPEEFRQLVKEANESDQNAYGEGNNSSTVNGQAEKVDTKAQEQLVRLLGEQVKCRGLMTNGSNQGDQVNSVQDSPWCPIAWDGALCWPQTQGGKVTSQPCPSYVYGFNYSANATRTCTLAGSWFTNLSTNESWTNYTSCKLQLGHSEHGSRHSHFEAHVGNIRLVTRIGYAVSLVTLLVAFIILTFNKRLRCPRNNLHLQLFLSFIIRSLVFHVKSTFFTPDTQSILEQIDKTEHYAFLSNEQTDTAYMEQTDIISCKVFTVIWQYSLLANYNWILMEGVYLHNLVFLHIFNDNSSIIKYIIAGWGLPVFVIIPWTIVRVLYENRLCWTTNQIAWHFWIIRGPITISIVLNFVFFINITRVLFVKMFSPATAQFSRGYDYRKWFKSTLVLVPLFGVHYTFLLIFNSISLMSRDLEIVWLYVDLLFTSFQGFFVALLYCFLNGEVQQEMRKWWRNHWLSAAHANSQPPSHSNTYHSILAHSLTYLGRGGRNSIFANDSVRKDSKNSRSPSPQMYGDVLDKRDSASLGVPGAKDLLQPDQLGQEVECQGSSESIM
ncbi:Parathyroid hormone/parathyroid hormone-related peptide receptor [Halotydeus destructor]|nr:Parathyroid hormone/parathyroid hormone-related peptide receptor [Halotydeus destructor]